MPSGETGEDPRCPICREETGIVARIECWGTRRHCRSCGLFFVDPLRLGVHPTDLFGRAYAGDVVNAKMREFSERVAMRQVYLCDPSLSFWSPAYHRVGEWLQQRLPAGSRVLEVGCGLGYLLLWLRNHGFEPVGVDPALPMVELNRQAGLEVYHGTVEVLTDDVQPAAIVCSFMFHHLEDPLAFLLLLHQKWPAVPIAIMQYGPGATVPTSEASDPPRTLSWWSSAALGRALELAGFVPTLYTVPSTGVERVPAARRLLRPLKGRIAIHRFLRRVERRVLPYLTRRLQAPDYVLFAIGEPIPEACPRGTEAVT